MATIEARGSRCHLLWKEPDRRNSYLANRLHTSARKDHMAHEETRRVSFTMIIHDRCQGTGICREAKARILSALLAMMMLLWTRNMYLALARSFRPAVPCPRPQGTDYNTIQHREYKSSNSTGIRLRFGLPDFVRRATNCAAARWYISRNMAHVQGGFVCCTSCSEGSTYESKRETWISLGRSSGVPRAQN
jgi:hypothetical protein